MATTDEQRATTDRKASLVEFLRSIQFRRRSDKQQRKDAPGARSATPFATLKPKARPARQHSAEDALLVRSAN